MPTTPPQDATRKEWRPPTPADFDIPARFVVGLAVLIFGTILFVLCWIDHIEKNAGMTLKFQILTAGGLTLAILAAIWLKIMDKTVVNRKFLLHRVETITGLDVDRDGVVGAPTFRIEEVSADHNRISIMHPPGGPDKFSLFAAAVLTSGSLAESSWSGSGGSYTKPEFTTMRDELIARGWLRWNNPSHHSQGVAPTQRGIESFKRWLAEYQFSLSPAVRTHAHAPPEAQIALPEHREGEGK